MIKRFCFCFKRGARTKFRGPQKRSITNGGMAGHRGLERTMIPTIPMFLEYKYTPNLFYILSIDLV